MKYLAIRNNGELDPRLISLMGGSTKAGKHTIGQFGTGLKYTLAYLFRDNIDFGLFVGTGNVPITTVKEDIGGTPFDIIHIDGQRTSVTTNMGLDWKGWMIVRELWCNALDEGGAERWIEEGELHGKEGCTTFYIQLCGEIAVTWENWSEYFIENRTPLFENDKFKVYLSTGTMCIYKQGVLIYRATESKSLFDYDMRYASINELREYQRYLMSYDIVEVLAAMDKNAIEYFLSNLKEKHYEYTLDYEWNKTIGQTFSEAVGDCKVIAKEDLDSLKARGVDMDEGAMIAIPKGLHKVMSVHKPSVSAVRSAGKVGSFVEQYNPDLELKLKSAFAVLESCGYYVDPELTWIFGIFGSGDVMGRVSIDEKVVMMSERHCDKGMFDMITTVVEENEHSRTKYGDCSREFQQHFINMYVKEMLKRNDVNL